MDHVWMRHGVTGGTARLPDDETWRALGWEPCDAPTEIDPALAERTPTTEAPTVRRQTKSKGD